MESQEFDTMILDKTKPLWMPEGSVRAVLAMSIVGAFIYVCIDTGNTEALAAIAVMVAKDYFQSRNN